MLDLDNEDSSKELDFNKDNPNWNEMVDKYNQDSRNSQPSIDIVDVFNQIANTFHFIQIAPRPTQDPTKPMYPTL